MTDEPKPREVGTTLDQRDMVAIIIRSFFEVPEEETTEQVLAKTDPRFVAGAKEAVNNLMAFWAAKIRQMPMTPEQAEKALDVTGLAEVGKPEMPS